MAFSRYDPKTKEAIIKAATEARAADKPWKAAHAVAKAAGYKGSVAALDIMVRNAMNAGKAKPKAPSAKAPPVAAPAKPVSAASAKPAVLSRYDPKVKAAFIKAALDSRAAGKSWAEAHSAAKKAGYMGKKKGLDRMIRKSKPKKIAAKPKATSTVKVATPPTKAAKAAPAVANGYDPVHKMIDQIVKEKVKAVVEKAIAELRKAVE